MNAVVAIGALDTKGEEYAFLCREIAAHGSEVLLVDVGVLGTPLAEPAITRHEVARAAGVELADLVAAGDRGAAIATMADGAGVMLKELHREGRLDAVVGLGGTGGSSLIAQAMRELPVGVPKLLVSTVASGNTAPYVGATDITMMYSVVDIAGINEISTRILSNAAAAVAGMSRATGSAPGTKPLIAASMFGVTTPCVTTARERLESEGYEALVFHQTGTGGQSMEELIRAGYFAGVLDVTTTELCDEVVGGIFPACPHRLESAGALGVPQVVSLGALDMVNFGPRETVPPQFEDRNLYVHNPTTTLMRTSPEECARIAARLAAKLNAASGPTALFIPLGGISTIATEGQPFHDPEADHALLETLREQLADRVEVHELDLPINAPEFARAMTARLEEMLAQAG